MTSRLVPFNRSPEMVRARRYLRMHMEAPLTPRRGSAAKMPRVRRESTLPVNLRVACYGCADERKTGEVGSLVLNGERWLCDPCTKDNRASVQGEALAAHRPDFALGRVRGAP